MLDWLAHTLLLGSFYAAIGVGFSLYFGTMRLINLSHGDVLTFGAFSALIFSNAFGPIQGVTGLVIILGASLIAGFILGAIIEYIAFRRIRESESFILLLTSVAVSIILREGLALIYPNGANPHPFPDPFQKSFIVLGKFQIKTSVVITISLLAVCVVALALVIRKTNLGRKMRAVAQDSQAAAMIGINVDRIMTITFAVASALVCMTGCLYGTVYEVIKYDMGLLLGLRGFAAAALGGIHRIEGGILGGFLLAAMELGSARILPGGSGYRDVVVFTVLILVLATRPRGILGKPKKDIQTSISRQSRESQAL